jgi:hypothetical protein
VRRAKPFDLNRRGAETNGRAITEAWQGNGVLIALLLKTFAFGQI